MSAPEPIPIVVADDHAPTRAGIRMSLEADGFVVVAEAATARQAVELARLHQPPVCLLDVHMPGNGIAAAREIDRALPGTAVVMLTYSREDEDLFDALRAGVRGFLVKDMDPDRLGAALRGVLAGEAALPRSLVAKVLDDLRGRGSRKVFGSRRPAQLTSREWEIMELLRSGATTEEVANRLFVTPGTIRVHVSSVLRKLSAPNREAALRMLDRH